MTLKDKLRSWLTTLPRWGFLLAIPIVAFVFATAVTFGLSGDESDGEDDTPTLLVSPTAGPENLDLPPTLTPEPTTPPTEADPTNRENCDAIRGTDYLSPEEREWYLANCLPPQDVGQTASDGGSSGSGGGSSGGGGGTGGYVPASEFALGDRLIVPSIGIDAQVNGAVVPASGHMPDPVGYFHAVWYDFRNHPGVGGPGLALFNGVSKLQAGATARYVTNDGTVHEYVVRGVAAYSPNANWGAILASGQADMTLITCGGTWDPVAHEYSTRWAAFLDKVG